MEKKQGIDNLILPIGTQVLTRIDTRVCGGGRPVRRGAVGVVVVSPTDMTHAYRVRLPDGSEVSLKRNQLSIHRQADVQRLTDRRVIVDIDDARPYIIYRCVVGSHAYRLDNEQSDTDHRGVFLPPARLHWSLFGVPEQVEGDVHDECYWELGKFVMLALKANPNILECLYSPIVETVRPPADRLLAMRDQFLSKRLYATFNGYAMSQFKKMEQDLRNRGRVKWKHAMHLVRLLHSGIHALRERTLKLDVEGTLRDRLLAVRAGRLPWDEVNRWRLELHGRFEEAFGRTSLPDRPDYVAADQYLIEARRMMVDAE